jgi:hypothetical protein
MYLSDTNEYEGSNELAIYYAKRVVGLIKLLGHGKDSLSFRIYESPHCQKASIPGVGLVPSIEVQIIAKEAQLDD